MELTPVKSSLISGMNYDTDTQILIVAFKSGDVYQYLDVPPEIFDGLLLSRSAGSVGKYFMKNVRDKFESVKVEKK